MKDEEIYNIFDTKKILGRNPGVSVSKTSGAAGIAYWINEHYGLSVEDSLTKDSPVVVMMKDWVDQMYADGRNTVMSSKELDAEYKRIKELLASQTIE